MLAAVVDPMGNGTERLYASVNSRVDILEWERSHGHIGENAYRTGRLVQAIFERLGNISGTNWCGASRMDPSLARELNVIRSIDSAAKIQELMEKIRGRIGMIDTRLMRRVLGERLSYAECSALQGKGGGDRGTTYIAKRFREALEDLAESWIGKGKATPAPVDKHAGAAPGAAKRQMASIAAGATLERLEAELADLRTITRPKREQQDQMEAIELEIGRMRALQARTVDGAARD
ncbi:hypothetical protein [Beijerinckia sp. L45]|uniref:hypothetical protein n=1 Tax=Beijerinckia sp. L45 TaxID=1641855 RepID=UPI00131B7699|nr:hypothetical protein [Beijerinckia sp. L45]